MSYRLERDMTLPEIEAATENDDVDWGFIDCGPRAGYETLRNRLHLWCQIIGRVNQADYRTGPMLAWRICAGVHPWRERVRCWGIIADRRIPATA